MKTVILGICAFNHDAAAALIVDGHVLGFLEEERLTEQKSTGAFPHNAIATLLRTHGLTPAEITDIAFYFDPARLVKSYFRSNNPLALLYQPYNLTSGRVGYELIWMLNFIAKARRIPASLKVPNCRLHFIPHHDCHIWYGIFAASRPSGVVISNDSVGEDTSSIALSWTKSDAGIATRVLFQQRSPHSVGYLYGAVTERLGFNRQHGAGKVMALASYCDRRDPHYFLNRIALHRDGRFSFKPGLVVDRSYKPAARRLHPELDRRYPLSAERNATHFDLAYGVQKATEAILDNQVAACAPVERTIVLTGGVAQNSVANGILTSAYPNNEILVPPVPHDSGCALGAALLCAYRKDSRLPPAVDTAFLGTVFTDAQIAHYLEARAIVHRRLTREEATAQVCDALVTGQTVGLFRGPMECGPRALGNRSILALPTVDGITEHLNTRVKYRETFRPYGVIVLEQDLHRFFEVPATVTSVPHMTHVFALRSPYRNLLRAVMHVDGTCRVQTCRPGDRFLLGLLARLAGVGGFPMVINTSMNVMGKPISHDVGQALACLYTSGLDKLLFNETFLVTK